MIYEGRSNSSIVYLYSFILANNETMIYFDHKFQFISRITKVISKFGSQHATSLPYRQIVNELSFVLINWGQIRMNQMRNNNV